MAKIFACESYFVAERPSSGIAGWCGGWIAKAGSEGTRSALLPAGPVPERWHVGLMFIETPHGPAISCTSLFGLFVFLVVFFDDLSNLVGFCLQIIF